MKHQKIYCDVSISLNEMVSLYDSVHADAGSSSKLIPYTWNISIILTNSSGVYYAYATSSAVNHNN